jgi:pyruvate/2-oxoglutarate dehydrogenase complex dihydrolipoamide dehydrogenase (E3) component
MIFASSATTSPAASAERATAWCHNCVFTDPPLAHIGLSESDAQRQGIAVRIGKLPMNAVLRREATDQTQGFMKVLVGANDDRILGFTMIGADAGEVMAAMRRRCWPGCRTRSFATPLSRI